MVLGNTFRFWFWLTTRHGLTAGGDGGNPRPTTRTGSVTKTKTYDASPSPFICWQLVPIYQPSPAA